MRHPLLGLASLALLLVGCARQECDFHSECGGSRYCSFGQCRQDCQEDFDCDFGEICTVIGQCGAPDGGMRVDAAMVDAGFDAGRDREDAGRDAGTDAGARDAGRPDSGLPDSGLPDSGLPDSGLPDSGPPDSGPPDSGPPPGRYLDRCVVAGDCASGRCTSDLGTTSFCTRTCATHTDCASEHLCVSGRCEPSDVGQSCTMAAQCRLNLCVGSAGRGECSRTCTTGADCPSGMACSAAGGLFICVDIERPCSTCTTGLCLAGSAGCTATCRTAADCPTTFVSLGLNYTCEPAGAAGNICVPHAVVSGSDPLGALCREVGGVNLCRSAACVLDFAGTSRCTQACNETTGCGPGAGCVPADDGMGGVLLLCQPSGSFDLTQPCTSDVQCRSGLCHATARICTRLCTSDMRCPTGLTCRPDPIGLVSTCSP